jgi:hypothetical protein
MLKAHRGGVKMIDYIWLDDESPLLNQLPSDFRSAAILLHPFVRMPKGWEQNKRKNKHDHIYPTDDEMLHYGNPVSWKEIVLECEFKSLEELAVALKTSIGALRREFAREDLAEKLNSNIEEDLFYPHEDYTPVFPTQKFIRFF